MLPITADAYAGSSINVVAGLQNTLFTDRDTQYAAFYAGDGTVVLARRKAHEDVWTTTRTGLRGNVVDAHNTIAIAVDGEGYIHLAWNHHNTPLNYVRGRRPGSFDFGPSEPMTGRNEQTVSYPQFLRLPDGDLLFLHREGSSGRGNLVLKRYATRTRTWTQVQANLIDGEGERSAYPMATVDREGVLHLTWNWRDTPDVATNHDLCYARSPDGGRTWTTSRGEPLAMPLTVENAEYALRVPAGRSLMNPPAITVDRHGRPCLANYWCPDGSDVPQYHLVRHDGSAWRVYQVTQRKTAFTLSGMGTKRPPISRCVLLSHAPEGQPQAMHLVYRDDEWGGRIVAASCRDLDAAEPEWSVHDLTRESVGAWEPSLDPEQARSGELHMLVQRVEQRDGDDARAAAVPPSPIASLVWSPAG